MPTTDHAAWILAGNQHCQTEGSFPERSYRMVLLGAPGVGKGTQAEYLCRELGTCHLSTGDVFRAAKCHEGDLSPVMRAAMESMRRGELVSDETVIAMVHERVGCLKCRFGFLLDGFPRTAAQAEALGNMLWDRGLRLEAVLDYELPTEEIIARLSGRRTCRDCMATFHIQSLPPAREGICDHCGGELYQREDDSPESIRVRLAAYRESTAPLIEFYTRKRLLVTVSAQGAPEEIFARTMERLHSAGVGVPAAMA